MREIHLETKPAFDRVIVKDYLGIVQSSLGILVIGAGAIWFMLQQSLKPQIKLEQTYSQRPLVGKPNYWLVAIDVRATNTGKVRVWLRDGRTSLTWVNPTDGREFLSVPLKDIELDPGETDQALFKTFALSESTKTIQFTSQYIDPADRRYQWELSSVLDVGSEDHRSKVENSK